MSTYNLLDTPLVTTVEPLNNLRVHRSLPEVFAALARGEIGDFPRLRPHQRHVWHALLCQLAALAMHAGGLDEMPEDPVQWRDLLLALTPDDTEADAWALISPPTRPAFLQAPVPERNLSGFKQIRTPDALDMLVMSKNHDVKAGSLPGTDTELWLYALVSLQTQEGFLGAGNFGVSRMNGGFASRSALSAVRDGDWSTHVVRDVLAMTEHHDEWSAERGFRSKGGLGLVWLRPWDGETALKMADLDIFYVEICRRVRLHAEGDGLVAWASGSKGQRIEAKALSGVTGDPWTPVIANKDGAKALTVDSRGWSYAQLVRLLFPRADSGKESVTVSPLQHIAGNDPSEGMAYVARVLVRGQGKTEGYFERRIPVSKSLGRMLRQRATDKIAQVAHQRVEVIGEMSRKVLFPAIMMLLTGAPRSEAGERARDDDRTKDRARAYVARFDTRIDARFFADLDAELDVLEDVAAATRVRALWIRDDLRTIGLGVLDEAIAAAPDAAARHWRMRVAARDVFDASFRKVFGEDLHDVLGEDPDMALDKEAIDA